MGLPLERPEFNEWDENRMNIYQKSLADILLMLIDTPKYKYGLRQSRKRL